MKDFDWLPEGEIAKLEEKGIRNTAGLYEAAYDSPSRNDLLKSTGVDTRIFETLVCLADLIRVQWVSPTAARMLMEASCGSVSELAKTDAEELYNALIAVNEGDRFFKGKIGLRDVKRLIKAASYARNNEVPYLGLCLGMQVMVIEFARYCLNSHEPNSSEFDASTPYPVIDLLPDQINMENKGATMRLGEYPCKLLEGSHAAAAYGQIMVNERHRHRYEFNNEFRDILAKEGMIYSGLSPDNQLVEICELTNHNWMVSCQFHPEFGSRPGRPHPLFRDFIGIAKDVLREGAQVSLPLET